MQFSKPSFIALLAAIFVLPFIAVKIAWILNAIPATGTRWFMGKTLNGQFSSEYPVIRFVSAGNDTIFFKGAEGVVLEKNEEVPILYPRSNPAAARVNSFQGLWVDTTIYASIPLVILLIIFLHPEIIPWKSRVQLGGKPFIRLQQ